jgi:hypothetical protein
MSISTLSNTIIETRKVQTLEAQNLRKVVQFRDINIIDGETLEYNGTRITITKAAFKNLLGLLGMSATFATRFETLFTKEAKAQFINTMKNAMASNSASNSGKLSEVTLVLNPYTKTVVAITKKDDIGISNQQFMNVAENIIDNHSMDVKDWSIDPDNGIITINAFNPKANFAVSGLSNEVFTGGVTFKNSPKDGFQVLPYVNRQWCSNGLTSQFAAEAYTLSSLDSGSMEKFFENLNELRKNNFAPVGFADRVRIANATPASLSEIGFGHRLIEPFAGERSSNWIHYDENMNAYKGNTSVWDVVNGINHFASNGAGIIDTNMQDYNATELMIKAGNLFGKKSFDHENHMPNVFGNSELLRGGSSLN